MLIALVWVAAPASIVALQIANIAMHALACVLLARMARAAFDSELAGVVAGLLWAINPFALRYVVDVQTEPLFTVLIAAGIVAVTATRHQARTLGAHGWMLGAGLLFGAAALTRPVALAIGPAVCAAAVAWPVVARHATVVLTRGTAFIVGMVIVVAPWTWANWQATEELIVVSDGAGYHMWVGNHPDVETLTTSRFADRDAYDRFVYPYLLADLPAAQVEQWRRDGIEYDALGITERDRLWRQAAIDRVRDDPAAAARRWAVKAWELWRPWLRSDVYGWPASVATGIGMAGLIGLAVAGGWSARRSERGRQLLAVVATLVAATTVAHLATHVLLRFRVPTVDPYLTVLAAGGLIRTFSRIAGGGRRAPQPLADDGAATRRRGSQ